MNEISELGRRKTREEWDADIREEKRRRRKHFTGSDDAIWVENPKEKPFEGL